MSHRIEIWANAKRVEWLDPMLEAALQAFGVHVGDEINIDHGRSMVVTARSFHQWSPASEVVLRVYTKLRR